MSVLQDIEEGVEGAASVALAPATGGSSLMPMLAGLLGSGVGMIGQNAQNKAQLNAASSAQQFSAQQVTQQESFQERMSDTAEQRNVADLKAAGINPMLATGQMASTPTGGAGTGVQAQQGNVLGAGAQTAMQAFSTAQAAAQTQAAIENTQADTRYKQLQAQALPMTTKAGARLQNAQADAIPSTIYDNQADAAGKFNRIYLDNIMQPFQQHLMQAQTALTASQGLFSNYQDIEEAPKAQWAEKMGQWAPGMSTARDLIGIMGAAYAPELAPLWSSLKGGAGSLPPRGY